MHLIHCNKGDRTKWGILEGLSKEVMEGLVLESGFMLGDLGESSRSMVLLWFGCYQKEGGAILWLSSLVSFISEVRRT